jgi:hypothetical protein
LRNPAFGSAREWRSGRSWPLLSFGSGGEETSPEHVAATRRSLEREVSRRHEHPSRRAREHESVPFGSCLYQGGHLPARACRRTAPGKKCSDSGAPRVTHPEQAGKKIPSESGSVLMTAGRFPV